MRLLCREGWDALLIALLGAWMLFGHLGCALLEPDEARYAEIPRLMLQSGDWVTPRLQGKPYNDKPPLVYWLIAVSYATFGTSIESARLVPTFFGWLTLLTTYSWTRRYLGRSQALLGGVVLLTMVGYTALTRMLLLDGVLAFFVVASLLTGHHALARGGHRGWWLLSAVLCGGGILTKGPVAVVLVLPCLIALRWLDRSLTAVRLREVIGFCFVAGIVAAPWYIAMLLTNETFGAEFFLRHHVQRFLAPAHHERPFWFYLPALFLELMPWSFVALAVWSRWRAWTGPERLLMLFACWCFVFFSLARCKLPTYLLPMLPTVAMTVGVQLHRFMQGVDPARLQRIAFGAAATLLLVILAFRDVGVHLTLGEGSPRVDYAALAALVALLTAVALVHQWRRLVPSLERRSVLGWSAALVVAWCITQWFCHDAIGEFAESTSVVPPCRQLARVAEGEGIPYVAYRNSWDAVSFMLGRGELEVFSSKELETFVAWLQAHPRCMVWMREGDRRVARFVGELPAGIELENVFDLGKVQGLILRRADQRLATTSR
jgi:4-amino-4-deoxy-L-arabinose transferase-like glycosyltransferase